MIANLRVLKRGNAIYLKVCHDLVDTLLKKLRMYIMMSKVNLEDASDSLIHFGYAGADAERYLSAAIGDIPANANDSVHYKSLSITRLSGDLVRFEILGEYDDAQQLWQTLDVQAAPVSSDAWRYLNIVAGIPIIHAENSMDWIPQMLNFERIGGVSFTKGCYPGQEIVARLNYLGKTKRRTYRLLAKTDQLPAIGTKIMFADAEGKLSESGEVLNTVINPDGKVEMLAVLKSATLDKPLSLDNAAIEVLDLPYSLED
jgi:folate-binding protein YgfZ